MLHVVQVDRVDVHIDHTGEDVLAGGVDHPFSAFRCQPRLHRRDLAALHAHIRQAYPLPGDDGAVANDEIVGLVQKIISWHSYTDI